MSMEIDEEETPPLLVSAEKDEDAVGLLDTAVDGLSLVKVPITIVTGTSYLQGF
jgi:hypothetical protein